MPRFCVTTVVYTDRYSGRTPDLRFRLIQLLLILLLTTTTTKTTMTNVKAHIKFISKFAKIGEKVVLILMYSEVVTMSRTDYLKYY